MDNVKFEGLSPPMLVIILISLSLIIFFLIIEPKIFKKKLSNKNEHGSSKFADLKEIKKNYNKEKINEINKVGFPIYYEKINGNFENIYFDTTSPHYLLVGSTGSGKSATVSIPMGIHFAISKEKHSVVFTDPKGELFKTTGKIFEDNGYDIVTIDFRNPTKSTKINLMQPIIDEWKEHCLYDKKMLFFLSHFLKFNKISISKLFKNEKYLNKIKSTFQLEDYIIEIIKNNEEELVKNYQSKKIYENNILKDVSVNTKEYLNSKSNEEILLHIKENQNKSSKHQAETNRLVISLANLIFTEKESKDPFWINSAKQLFIGIVGIFIEDYKLGLIDEKKINISSIKKFQNSSLTKENQNYFQKNLNNRKYGSLSKDYLTSIISSAENTYKSITAIFGERMSIFDDLNVENITSVNEFYFTNLAKKPTALYIMVPDEDRSYFQLVTIIIGMLIKDLTKYANLPENNGTLPIPIEWILDEFANCPPLDAIETVVSVARSRKMRFFFFIQSFSQLNQVYGKEIANIIQDNCALVYLKTNTVETAEVIAKKLGKSTIETNSMSMSTDPFKVGANQTKSLMGKELLTANEIINLKYKTIIFPTFGNPIFRNSYMYSDLYPQYKNVAICKRPVKILKRLTENYYTVEDLRKVYTNLIDDKIKEFTSTFSKDYEKEVNKSVIKAKKNYEYEMKIYDIANRLVQSALLNMSSNISMNNNTCIIDIDMLLPTNIVENIENFEKDNYIFSVIKNEKKCTTKILISEEIRKKVI